MDPRALLGDQGPRESRYCGVMGLGQNAPAKSNLGQGLVCDPLSLCRVTLAPPAHGDCLGSLGSR